jgi:serine/threonine protein kinase
VSDPLIGQVLANRNRVVRAVGAGGMGAVYEALQLDLERRVAIKVLKPEVADDPAHVERFRREAITAAKLAHPNIPQIFEFIAEPGAPLVIVMELLTGVSLHTQIAGGPMACDRACAIAAQLASALGAAHDAGIVHRDLKPGNVILVPFAGGDLAMLLDFGVAKLRESAGYTRLTQTGMLVGTPRYASPEQSLGRPDIDGRSDIYSLGVLLYKMLTGKDPFSSSGAQLLIDIQQATPVDVRRIVPTIPAGVAEIVERAMQKEPGRRFANARQMGAALEPHYVRASGPGLLASPNTTPGGVQAPLPPSAHEAPTKAPSKQTPAPELEQPTRPSNPMHAQQPPWSAHPITPTPSVEHAPASWTPTPTPPVWAPPPIAPHDAGPEPTDADKNSGRVALISLACAGASIVLAIAGAAIASLPGLAPWLGVILALAAPPIALAGIIAGGIGMSGGKDTGLAIGGLSLSIVAFFAAFIVAMGCGVCGSCAPRSAEVMGDHEPRLAAPLS